MQEAKYGNGTHQDHGNKHMKHTMTMKLNGRHLERRSWGVTSLIALPLGAFLQELQNHLSIGVVAAMIACHASGGGGGGGGFA